MVRNLKITVDGRAYNVTVEDMGSPAESFYLVPGTSTEAPEPVIAERPRMASTSEAPVAATSAVAAGSGDVTSPMTGVLIEYTVKVGEAVAANQHVATIEAMKMKTVVVSRIAGKVVKLCAEPGASVDSGQVLLVVG